MANPPFSSIDFHDADFLSFLQEAVGAYCTREDFEGVDIPGGADRDEVWELIAFCRRMNGWPHLDEGLSAWPGFSVSEMTFWTATPSVSAKMSDIARRTSSHSDLWGNMASRLDREPLLVALVSDLDAAAFRDGISIRYEAIRSLLVDGREPVGAAEELVERVAAVCLSCFDAEGKSPSFMMDESSLTNLLDELESIAGSLPMHCYVAHNAPNLDGMPSMSVTERILLDLHSHVRWGTSPLYDLFMASDVLWEGKPLPHFNGLMEVVLRVGFLVSCDMPALAFVPLSRLRLEWERGVDVPVDDEACRPAVRGSRFVYGQALVRSSFGIDCTPYLEHMTRVLGGGVAELERDVQALVKADDAERSAILADGRLGMRQRDLMLLLVDKPSLQVDVYGYQQLFDVSPATARADLNKLVDFKLLLADYDGKKQVFWKNPRGAKRSGGRQRGIQ